MTRQTPARPTDKFDDDDYPAYTMGRAAEMIGTTPAFLRAVGEARLIVPLRSEGGHRRYSRYQLRIAARARELVDQGTPVEAACRIVILEDQLEEAQRLNEELRGSGAGSGSGQPPGP
ncbi:MerR family transcriptional regulator [Streptomyces lydicus]|uniref:MerR family transcriptional regulator n=1 Tax=Streptomyces lydicus TaxID=47763 RepID=UPI0036F6A335